MVKIYKGLPFLLLIMIAGCGTFKVPWQSHNTYQKLKYYELNEEKITSVGNAMVTASHGLGYYNTINQGVKAWKGKDISSYGQKGPFDKNKWRAKYIYGEEDGDYVLVSDTYFRKAIGIIIEKDGTVPTNPILRIDRKGSLKRFPIILPDNNRKVFSKKIEENKNAFKFELIYTGIIDEKLNITYREYSGDLARSSFYQNLIYDLNKSKIIRFKSLEIEVIKATNSEIVFKVLEDGNLEWMP